MIDVGIVELPRSVDHTCGQKGSMIIHTFIYHANLNNHHHPTLPYLLGGRADGVELPGALEEG